MIAADYTLSNLKNTVNAEVTFWPVSRPVKSFKEEITTTAKNIYSSASKPLYLGYSGGIDSEVIARAFLECNIPFTAITFRYLNNVNSYDINYAIKFCKENNIKHIIVDVNPIEIYQSLLSSGNKFLDSWFNYMQVEVVKCVDRLGGCAVLGMGGLADFPLHTVDNEISIKILPGSLLSEEWCRKENKLHFPYFFLQNPEIYTSYLEDPLMQHLLSEPNYFKNRTRTPISVDFFMKEFSYPIIEKLLIFYKFWPEMERRPKYDGFEKFRPVLTNLENKFRDINITPIPTVKRIIDIKSELGLN